MSLSKLVEGILEEATTPKKKKLTQAELKAKKEAQAEISPKETPEKEYDKPDEEEKEKTNFIKTGRSAEEIAASAAKENEEEKRKAKEREDALAKAQELIKAKKTSSTSTPKKTGGFSKSELEELAKKVSAKKSESKPEEEAPKLEKKKRGRPSKPKVTEPTQNEEKVKAVVAKAKAKKKKTVVEKPEELPIPKEEKVKEVIAKAKAKRKPAVPKPAVTPKPKEEKVKEVIAKAKAKRKPSSTKDFSSELLKNFSAQRKEERESALKPKPKETPEERKARVKSEAQDLIQRIKSKGGTTGYLRPLVKEPEAPKTVATPKPSIENLEKLLKAKGKDTSFLQAFKRGDKQKTRITNDSVINKIVGKEKLSTDELAHYNRNLTDIEDGIKKRAPKPSEAPKPKITTSSVSDKIVSGQSLSDEERQHYANNSSEVESELKKRAPKPSPSPLPKPERQKMSDFGSTQKKPVSDKIADILSRIHRLKQTAQQRTIRDIPKLKKAVDTAKEKIKSGTSTVQQRTIRDIPKLKKAVDTAKEKIKSGTSTVQQRTIRDLPKAKSAIKKAYNAFIDQPKVGSEPEEPKVKANPTPAQPSGRRKFTIHLKSDVIKGGPPSEDIIYLHGNDPKDILRRAYEYATNYHHTNPEVTKLYDEHGTHYDPKEHLRHNFVVHYSHSGGRHKLYVPAHTPQQAEVIAKQQGKKLGHKDINIDSLYNKNKEKDFHFTYSHEKKGFFGTRKITDRVMVSHATKKEAENQARREYIKKYKLKRDHPITLENSHQI